MSPDPLYTEKDTCRLCNSENLRLILSLRPTPLANSYAETRQEAEALPLIPLDLNECTDCLHIQLGVVVSAPQLFRDYLYVSGTSSIFRKHFREYADSMMQWIPAERPLVVDIGSNDGTLLKYFLDQGCAVQGIDPARNVAELATENGIPTLPEFFSKDACDWILAHHGQADLVTANNVCAHVDDLRSLMDNVRHLLKPSGVFSFEVSYLLDVEENLLFDTIYHEHLDYHKVTSLVPFLKSCGLTLVDVKRVPSHGGSIRCIAVKSESSNQKASAALQDYLDEEEAHRGKEDMGLAGFAGRISILAQELQFQLSNSVHSQREVWGFGAPAKATTLMHQLELNSNSIAQIVDDSPLKVGRFMPGSGIPIVSADELVSGQPTKIVILAWNFAEAIADRLIEEYMFKGPVLTPLPILKTLNARNQDGLV